MLSPSSFSPQTCFFAIKARKLFEEALASRQKSLPPGSVYIADSWLSLAQADAVLGNLPAAAIEAQRADSMYQASIGPSSVFVAQSHNVMAEIAAAEEHWPESQSLAEKALELSRATLPSEHPTAARAQSSLGWALWKQGKPEEAILLLQAAYAADCKTFHDLSATPQAYRMAANWSAFLRANGRGPEADRVASESGIRNKLLRVPD